MKSNLCISVPVGFIYTQLPDQDHPEDIWPQVEWADITEKYAGQFFRVEGGASAAFGTIQAASSPRVTQVKEGAYNSTNVVLKEGEWSEHVFTGANAGGTLIGLSFYTSKNETRPINQAVRIFKRGA
jgi:hypothetical protein